MTELELQELSKAVAAKYGIEACLEVFEGESHNGCDVCDGYVPNFSELWLHADSGRCFDLAAEEGLEIDFDNNEASSVYWLDAKRRRFSVYENHSYHNNKQQAARVAVLRALLAKGE